MPIIVHVTDHPLDQIATLGALKKKAPPKQGIQANSWRLVLLNVQQLRRMCCGATMLGDISLYSLFVARPPTLSALMLARL